MPTPRKVLRAASRSPRRHDYSSSTRKALVDNATALFTERGYAGTSLDEVVAAARVTKGALYHHYGGKLALFEHVVERAQKEASKKIARRIKSARDPWDRAEVGLAAFLEICQEPTYRRIVMQEAPVALGPERWQEVERASTFGLIEQVVADLFKQVDVEQRLVDTFTVIFYGALRAAGVFVADSEDPEGASSDVETVIGSVLLGLRNLEDVVRRNADGGDTVAEQIESPPSPP